MNSKHARLAMIVVPLILGACTSSGGAATDQPSQPPASTAAQAPAPISVQAPPSAEPSATPDASASPQASPDASAGSQPTVGPQDPCSVLTSAEASHLDGVTLGAGKHTVATPDSICTWAKGSTEVKVFLTPPTTPDAAKAYYEAHKGEIPTGAHITELPTFMDGAVIGRGTLPTGTISGIYVIDGTHFFEVYCGFPGCTDAALQEGAQLVAGRLQ